MSNSNDIEKRNQEYYLTQRAADWYATKHFVLPEEVAFLRDYEGEIRGKKVLDIGIGAGRSTQFLFPLASEYIGVDYSDSMVSEAARHYPLARVEQQDARDLSAYGDATFNMVIFSFNGLDCLAHDGRMKSLAEIRRVLKPGGIFAFSSHNRRKPRVAPWSLENIDLSKHPLRMWRNVCLYLTGIRNWMSSRADATQTEEYELRHDSGNSFMVPMYYIDKASQRGQLEHASFSLEKIYDAKGKSVDALEADVTSSWIFFVARKAD
jgi:SAM-dependent methyltransferase